MVSAPDALSLSGVPGSPYTRKMLALLRYRRIPYKLILGAPGGGRLPKPEVSLLPTFYLPDADGRLQAVTDSTPILRRLEREHPTRAVRPENPALAFVDSLLEDYGDEWLTKAMFHYRWAHPADVARATAVLPALTGARSSDAQLKALGEGFGDRQIGRLRYVGSNATTAPVIEDSYIRFLERFEAHLREYPFLLGGRPGASDFACVGQLTQLAMFDPTPMALTAERAPRVLAWVWAADDLSGLEPQSSDWFDPSALPETLLGMLREVGRVYIPLLIANAEAIRAGAVEVETVIDGRPWSQRPFPYQAKCLGWLREEYAGLDAANRTLVAQILEQTGCAPLLESL